MTQIISRLEYKTEWVQKNETHYHMYNPEFKLVEEYDDNEYDRRSGEFYIFSQTNSKFIYKNLKILCKDTVLETFQLVILDSGRFKTPIPQWGYVGQDYWGMNYKYTYKYYLKESISYKLQQYFLDEDDMEAVYAKRNLDEVVLYFDNEQEKIIFEDYVESNLATLETYIIEVDNVHFNIDIGNKFEVEEIKHRLSIGVALNKIFQSFTETYSISNNGDAKAKS